MTPEGWLVNPKEKRLILFHKDSLSDQRVPYFYMDKWVASSSGTPSEFIERTRVPLNLANETWNELVGHDWEQINHQFGDPV